MSLRVLPVLLLVLSLILAACQTGPDVPEATVQSTSAAATPTAARTTRTPVDTPEPTASPTPALPDHLDVDSTSLAGVEIEFWHPWQGDLAETAEQLAAEFSQSNEWGIRVRRQPFYSAGALSDEVDARLAEDPVELPDVVAAPPDHLAAWSADGGIVADLAEYIDHPEMGLPAGEVETFLPAFWAQDRQGEQQTGIPLLRSARVIFYNQTWARELGYNFPPVTPDQFEDQACAAAVANNGLRLVEKFGTGGWLIDNDPVTLLSWLGAFGAQPAADQAGVQYQFESEEAEAALDFLRGMLDDGCAWLGRSQTQYDYFVSRTALFYAGNLQDVYVQREISRMAGSSDEWTILPFPSVDEKPVVYASGYSLALLDPLGEPPQDEQARKERAAGWLFIRWMAEPRNLARLAEALPSIPVSSAVDAQLADYRQNFPWGMVLPLRDSVQPAPASASWRMVRRLVEDASWQIYHLPAEQVDLILPQLDEIAQELLEKD